MLVIEMTNNQQQIPAIRFNGFTDTWEQRKLEELAESFNYGLNASAMEFDGENKYIRITDIDEQSHKFIQSGLTSPNIDLLNADDYLLKEGDILFARTGASVGKSYQYEPLDGKVYYAGFLIRARIKPEFDPSFIFQNTLTEKYNNFIKVTSQRSGQPGVNAQEYANFSILIPSRGEQVKLGNFFKQLDDTIALHQRKLTLLEQLKKEYLTRMFPQNGENIPNLRFADFSEPWDQRKLGDLGSFKNGMNFNKSAMGHGHPFINLQNIFGKTIVDGTGLGLAVSSEKQRNEYNLLKGDVLFIRSSVKPEGVGEAALVPTNFDNTTFSGFIIRFRPHVAIDNEFKRVIFATKNVRNQIMALATSSANTNINQDSLEMIIIELPRLSEQSKIGNLFKRLDDALYLHQSKIEKLTELKKVLLANMFL